MEVYDHRGTYKAETPVLIFERSYISARAGEIRKEIRGAIKEGENILNVGDAIISSYISTMGNDTLPYKVWEVVEIKERHTPKGRFIIDISDSGFIAIVKPASGEVVDEINKRGIRI